MKKTKHCGNPKKSKRLRDTIFALGRSWKTSAEIQRATGSMAVHTDISDLRENGYNIPSRYLGVTNGRKIYSYRNMGK